MTQDELKQAVARAALAYVPVGRIIGVGTGSSTEAGYCGVFAAKRGNTAFIAVVLGAKTSGTRFDCGSALLDYGFASFRSVEINKKGDLFGQVAVNGSMRRSIGAAA